MLVLRALKSTGATYRINGDLDHLEAVLDDEGLRFGDEAHGSMGEIFIERIEPGDDGAEHRVPEGYEENGIWIRGEHDYAHPGVAGGIGSGWDPATMAYIAEARWVERRLLLDDAAEQVETVTAEDWAMRVEGWRRWRRWREVGSHEGLRYVSWIAPYSVHDTRSAPPLRMRLRCWYEVVIETRARKRIVLREEGLRGDNVRTASRALERSWYIQGPSVIIEYANDARGGDDAGNPVDHVHTVYRDPDRDYGGGSEDRSRWQAD